MTKYEIDGELLDLAEEAATRVLYADVTLREIARAAGSAVMNALVPVIVDRAARSKGEWQPIETVPMDGTDVLLWCLPCKEGDIGSIFTAYWEKRWVGDTWDDDDEHGIDGWWMVPQVDDKQGGYCSELVWEPTHWRPLPDAPKGLT